MNLFCRTSGARPWRLALPLLLAALVSLIAAGCMMTPVSLTPVATPTPAGGDWEDIQASGTLVVGTSADYPPFSFYDDKFRLTGFDPELARALGETLGLEVRFRDMPFEGLGDALTLGQIDMAIAAISATPERAESVDFTDVYYISEDAFLARADADVSGLGAIQEMKTPALIGVQAGSVYEQWVRRELIDKGLLPESNMLLYSDISRAVNDLERGRIDLVMLDLIPAEKFVSEREVKIVAQGLNRQRYVITVPLGANELRRNLNLALEKARDDGTLTLLATRFLGLQPGEALPLPTALPSLTPTHTATPSPTLTPTATRTPIPPAATATPRPPTATPTRTPIPFPTRCLDGMAWVADLTFDDNNMQNPPVLNPGQPFVKAWRVRNTGSCTWTNLYRLAFVRGNQPGAQMSGQPAWVNGRVPPGSFYDIQLPLVAPITPGTYQGFWQMFNDLNQPFGQRIWVGITVAGQPTATPWPTQTPSAQISFWANRTNIDAGQSVLFSWATQNVREVYFYREGQNWWNHGVNGNDSSTEYPSRTVSYFLRVVLRDGSVDVREIRINVNQSTQAPQIVQFSVAPEGQMALGQCAQINWDVRGDVSNVDLRRNGQSLWSGAPIRGQMQDCPPNAGSFEYLIEARGAGGTSRATRYLTVVSVPPTPTNTPIPTATLIPSATPTWTPTPTLIPTATLTPTPSPTVVPPALIEQFSVVPQSIALGECVSIVWSVSGDPSLIQIKRSGQILFDMAPPLGNGQDCPPQSGAFQYRIEVTNQAGVISDSREIPVAVVDQPPTPTTQPPTPTGQPQPPVIDSFTLSLPQITLGECVTLNWQYHGQDLVGASLLRNGDKLMGDPPLQGSLVDCPTPDGPYQYKLIVSSEFAGNAEQTVDLTVVPAP